LTISVAVESTLSAELCIMNSISLLFVLFTAAEVKSVCYSASYYATTSLKFLRYYSYSNNDDCLLSIIPSSLYRSGYYLELKWTTFDIEGSLPTCTDYVEVFIQAKERALENTVLETLEQACCSTCIPAMGMQLFDLDQITASQKEGLDLLSN